MTTSPPKKRTRYIGASEVAALFDAHPYMTRFQLWHLKKGNLEKPVFAGTERSFWGDMMEPVIAAGFCKKYGYDLIEVEDRFTIHPTIRQCCANLDYKITPQGDTGNVGLLECKASDFIEFQKTFINERLPLNYELQLQQEMMCSGESWAIAAVLVAGNDLFFYEREPRPAIIEMIAEAIEAFWVSQDEDLPPRPDYTRDGAALSALFKERDGSMKDFRGNNYLNNLCADYVRLGGIESAAKKQKDIIKAEIIDMTGKSSLGYTDGFDITARPVAEVELEYTRKSYVNLTIKERKTKR